MIGFIGTSLQLQLAITAHTMNSFDFSTTWIYESTAFYNFNAARIEDTTSNS
jgi:hypothetical protein